MEDNLYPYRGYKITPSVAKWLMEKLILNKLTNQTIDLSRKDIHAQIYNYHLQNGGEETPNSIFSLKKALTLLRDEGKCENTVMVGYWRFKHGSTTHITPPPIQEIQTPILIQPPKLPKLQTLVIGDGAESVYLYWFPSYKELAENKHESRWNCKIGRSQRDAECRINEQCNTTSIPEKPVIGVIFKTNCSVELEKSIHSILTYKKKQVLDISGKEWFKTSPNEVLGIYYYLNS